MSSAKYTALRPQKGHDDDQLSKAEPVRRFASEISSGNPKPWMFSTLALAALCVILATQLWKSSVHPLGTYETGFTTDMPLPSPIPFEQIRFTGTPRFDPNSSVWRTFNQDAAWPENVRYVGPPTPEMDNAWEDLIGCRYVSLTEKEAEATWGDTYKDYHDEGLGGYTAGLDVFHTLHCVNALRKSLYPNYYPETRLHGITHLEHCVDVLRQEVQCYGSTTLIPSTFFPAIEQNYIDSDQLHVCRSFRALREWTDRRRTGGDLHVERDREGIDQATYEKALEYNLDREGKLCS